MEFPLYLYYNLYLITHLYPSLWRIVCVIILHFIKIIICDQAFLMKIYMETKLLAINLIFIHFDMIFFN
jgi:hypothetical protein